MTRVRYAIVGAGWISQQAFMPAIAQTKNSVMRAIVSGDQAKARELAAFYDIPHVVGYDGYDELMRSGEIDTVYIALPNSMHAEYTLRAAEASIHAIVEKPPAVTIEDMRSHDRGCAPQWRVPDDRLSPAQQPRDARCL